MIDFGRFWSIHSTFSSFWLFSLNQFLRLLDVFRLVKNDRRIRIWLAVGWLTYPGNQLYSVDGSPINDKFLALYSVKVSWTYPPGLTYAPWGPSLDIEKISSCLPISSLQFRQHRTGHCSIRLISYLSLLIEQLKANNFNLCLSSRGRLAANQNDNSWGSRGIMTWFWENSRNLPSSAWAFSTRQ